MRYQLKKNYVWSSRIAYSVGLMASDGCLQSDGRHLDLTSNDIIQLQNFSHALKKELRIGTKRSSSGAVSSKVQFSDVAYYDFLIQAGLTPKKSKTLGALKIPDQFYPDFLRGIFDGDGTTYGYNDPRWPTSFQFYIGFTSASKEFLDYVKIKNSILCGTLGGSFRVSKSAIILSYGKNDSKILYDAMYKNANNLYLPRKKNKLDDFIIRDKNATIGRQARVVKLVNTSA